MALFNDIKKKVADTTQGAVKATKELAETARLNSQISDEQKKIENIYSQIGKLYYEQHGNDAGPPFDELCADISAAVAQIEKLQLDIQLVKGIKRCPGCGADVALSAGFCGKCGSKVDTPVPEPDTAITELHHCVNCGAELETKAMFCGSCGSKVEETV